VGAAVVVLVDEGVELGLQLGDGGRAGLAGEPFVEGLVEAFDAPMFVKPRSSWLCRRVSLSVGVGD
jgi:hypothetical protein